MEKLADTTVPIHPLLAQRYSPRSFAADKAVSHAQLIALCEAARWAPSCFGDEPWRLIVCDKNTQPDAWQQAYDCMVPFNQSWAGNAPVLIIITADTRFVHNDKPNAHGQYDTGAAAISLALEAVNQGLVTHQMGGFSADTAREKFAIPTRYTPIAMMAIGYQAPAAQLPAEMQADEQAARQRQPLGSRFFAGAWDQPITD